MTQLLLEDDEFHYINDVSLACYTMLMPVSTFEVMQLNDPCDMTQAMVSWRKAAHRGHYALR